MGSEEKKFNQFIEEKLHLSEFAWWDWWIPTNKVTFNDLKVKWLGYDPKDFQNIGFEAFTTLLHPDDYARAMRAMRDYLSGKEKLYKIDYRIKTKSGNYKWYIDRGIAVEHNESGSPIRLRGIVIDMGNYFSDDLKTDKMREIIRHTIPFSQKNNPNDNVITVCSNCKRFKINENKYINYKGDLEYLLDLRVSHSICPDCIKLLYPDLFESDEELLF